MGDYNTPRTENPELNKTIVGGLQLAMGVPQVRWMVDLKEKPSLERMMTGGTPMCMETPKCVEIHG